MLAYKLGINSGNRVLITLEIPRDAKTNMERSSIFDRRYAQYRANKVIVRKIEGLDGKELPTANSIGFVDILTYNVGDTLESMFEKDIEKVCASGIHFFLEKKVALNYGYESEPRRIGFVQPWKKMLNGVVELWHENGARKAMATFRDGKRNGQYLSWHTNGERYVEATLVNGEFDGRYVSWYDNGGLYLDMNYRMGKLDGECRGYHKNGKMSNLKNYVNGVENGIFTSWYETGQKIEEYFYVNGKREGMLRHWRQDGSVLRETRYVNNEVVENTMYD
jgi:antitoxin component YwqK of YwqJK toxin-antitoxin module